MANKNSRLIRKLVRVAGKAGEHAVTFNVPVPDYHNHGKSTFRPITVTTAIRNGDGIVSTSGSRRNMQMRILHNSNGDGGKSSLTVHEPINGSYPVIHPNHSYMANDPKGRGYFQAAK